MTDISADVVIVGGGIVGITTAYLLGKAGIESIVIEKDSVGSHASGFAYGGLSQPRRPEPASGVLGVGWRLHNEFADILQEETGVNIEFRMRPSLSLAFTDDEARTLKENLASRFQESDGETGPRWVDEAEAKIIEPRINPLVIGGVHVETGGADVEPYRLVLALTQAAEKLGATVRHGEVTGLKVVGGRVIGVLLGDREILCNHVVLSMGPWSADASNWLGIPIDVRPLKGQILRLQTPGAPFHCSLGWAGNYATTKPDGLLWTGTTEEDVGFDDNPTTDGRNKIMSSLLKMVPSLEDARLAQQTACLRPLSGDELLLLGKVPGLDGVYIGTGAGRRGIMLGPGMAQVITDLITTGTTNIPIDAFEPGRFA